MYQLYYSPGACSLAIQVILRELDQEFSLINKADVTDYKAINPVGTVPALKVGNKLMTEGAAILLHLLAQHDNHMLPSSDEGRQRVIQAMMFANATLHPAYSKLFFLAGNMQESESRHQLLAAAAKNVSALWQVVEETLTRHPYLAGDALSPADILIAVYSSWGQFFPVDIAIGPRSQALIEKVKSLPSYSASVAAEQRKAA